MYFRVCVVATLAAAAHADDLVAAIKYDLQQNNDDYADLRRARALTSPPRSSPPPSAPPTSPPSAPLVSATPEAVPKFLIPVEKQPHFDKHPPAALRRASVLNDSDSGVLEVVKVASWYPSFTTQRPKIIDSEPIIAKISEVVNGIGPKIAKSLDVNGIEPIIAEKSVAANGIGPIIAKKSVDVNGIEPIIAKKSATVNGIGSIIKKKSVIVNGIGPIIVTKSAVVKTLTTSRTRVRPVASRGRARVNDLTPRERFLRGKGVEKSIDSEYYKDLDDFVKRGSRLKGRMSSAAAARGARGPVLRAGWKARERLRQQSRPRGARGRGRGARGRGRGRGEGPARAAELPAAEVLDMAPARGARVYSKRLSHRLCSRSVLNPEGPKYNSAGQVYLQQFTPRGEGHFGFERTRAPRLLLPRCCNCCKKSVLGCE